MKRVSDEVLVADEVIVRVDRGLAAELQRGATANPRRRMRLCAHAAVDDPLHEMLIALAKETYIRPHMHPGKSESMHVIDGEADLVTFDEHGEVSEVIHLGAYGSGKTFFTRMAAPRYHMLLVRSDVLVVHETTNGPFRPDDTVFAPWAPDGADPEACGTFMARIERAIVARNRSAGKDA
jgi:cupin fold WbuC family metalloprotein